MSQWAAKRQLAIFIGLLAFFAIVAFMILWPRISKEPTCNDGKQNGEESGVDCGGSCLLMCTEDVSESVVLFSRAFNVSGDVYNAVAEVENPNPELLGLSRPYEFRFYDKENQFITRVIGFAYLAPNKTSFIFEDGIKTGNREIARTTFSWLESGNWYKVNKENIRRYNVSIDSFSVTNENTKPKIEASVTNKSDISLPAIDVVVVVFGENGNAIASSKTVTNTMFVDSSQSIYFTWPNPFPEKYSRVEFFPVIPGEYYAISD